VQYLHLKISNQVVNGKTKRTTHLYDDGSNKSTDIFYEFDSIVPWSDNMLLDGHVFAILLYACSLGKPLKIHGAISRTALRNIDELQLAWGKWKPDVYKKIDVIPDRVDYKIRQHDGGKAIAAFSGGVDATFTALRHTKILPENLRYPLSSVLMVHGFDVDLYNHNDFRQLEERVAPLLKDLNLEFRSIRTNSRDLKLQDWNDSHGLELAACLHMLSEEFEFGIIGSSGPYDNFFMPWGSSPVTDHLISGSQLSIIHDGAGFSRTEKVAGILNFPTACKTIKVCWSGADQSGNCGKCEKCVRTQLNFLAAGATSSPPCFSEQLNISDIIKVQNNKHAPLSDMRSLLMYATAHNISGEWLSVVSGGVVDREKQSLYSRNLSTVKNVNPVKQQMTKVISGLGIEEPVKKMWRTGRRLILKAIVEYQTLM